MSHKPLFYSMKLNMEKPNDTFNTWKIYVSLKTQMDIEVPQN